MVLLPLPHAVPRGIITRHVVPGPRSVCEEDMAKKKAAPKADPPEASGAISIINLKGSPAYREWLSGVSKKTHIPVASIVRLALVDWASKNGHLVPPER